MEVHNVLGCGLLEAVYAEALEDEMKLRKIPYIREKAFPVCYKGKLLAKHYKADFLCYEKSVRY